MIEYAVEFVKKPMNIILMGTVITICGALFGGMVSAVGTYLQNKSSSEKSSRIESGVTKNLQIGTNTNNEVLNLRNQNNKLISKIENQEKVIDNLRQENTLLYGKLQEASTTIFDHIKGGLGPTYLKIQYTGKDTYVSTMVNKNEYSVYGLAVQITDYDSVLNCKKKKLDNNYVVDENCFLRHTHNFSIAELGVGETPIDANQLGLTSILIRPHGKYQIISKSRYTLFVQQFIYKKIGKDIYTTSRILKVNYKNSTNIQNKIDSHSIEILRSSLKDWKVDFDEEFPTGPLVFITQL